MKTLLTIALIVVFNEFIGEMLALIGSLLIYIGNSITQIPEIF